MGTMRTSAVKVVVVATGLVGWTGCTTEDRLIGSMDDDETGGVTTVADDGGDDEGDDGMEPPLLDTADGSDGGDCGEGEDCNTECIIPEHTPCDADTSGLREAIGLNCAGELQVTLEASNNMEEAVGLRTGFGMTSAFDPTEGAQFVVLGSGRVEHLDHVNDWEDPDQLYTYCDSDLDLDDPLGIPPDPGPHDPGSSLPAPIQIEPVADPGCEDDPSLVGTGDCSNTIKDQFAQGMSANDYTDLRLEIEVPETVTSFSYDFAFLSYEYPDFYGSSYNDMYIGWLQSEAWTGNVSFDGEGNPISLNAGFLDFKDGGSDMDPDCPFDMPCSAPELHGTCMEGHAATKWLTTTSAVHPGETIQLVFAVFDLSDSQLDSFVFIDNFRWGCEGGETPPSTTPIP